MSIMVITGTMAGACLGSWALLKARQGCPLDLDLGEICLDFKKLPRDIGNSYQVIIRIPD